LDKCITFDFANPFNFLTGGQPARGDYLWFHAGRNISEHAHEQAQDLFHDVRCVMIPKFPMSYDTRQLLVELYGQYVEKHYVVLGRSEYWTLYGQPEARQARSGTRSR
jgi:hypothetical protein